MRLINKKDNLKFLLEKFKNGFWLDKYNLNNILNNKLASLDLNRTHNKIKKEEIIKYIGKNKIKKILESNVAYYFDKVNKKLIKIAIFDKYYYKLLPTENTPTLEISGVRMHRTTIDPYEDAKQKVLSLNPKGICLDTCMGLGYTAIWLSKYCEKVYTIEIDENVIEITKWNPWSLELYKNKNIYIIHGDSFKVIDEFEDEFFDFILHDPPTIFMAGNLYSIEFYQKLYRVLKSNGKLYHYTGYRGEKRGFDIIGKAMQRLNKVGFKTKRKRDVLGLIAEKK